MPWQKSYQETEVLERAMKAFWKHGYEATSMGDLVAATGINRGSIYSAFTSKRELFMRSLQHYDKLYREQHLLGISDLHTPVRAIIAVFESATQRPADKSVPWGCLLVNTALELSPHDDEIGRFVARSLQAVEDFFFAHIEAAISTGELGPSVDARATARALLGLFLGLRVLTRAQAPQPTIDAITLQARKMLS